MMKNEENETIPSSSSIIKTEEEVPSSNIHSCSTIAHMAMAGSYTSIDNTIRVKKEEEEEEEITNTRNTSRTSRDGLIRVQQQQQRKVKKEEKEEEEEKDTKYNVDDFSDWKKGNWCWLLPATTTTTTTTTNNNNTNKKKNTERAQRERKNDNTHTTVKIETNNNNVSQSGDNDSSDIVCKSKSKNKRKESLDDGSDESVSKKIKLVSNSVTSPSVALVASLSLLSSSSAVRSNGEDDDDDDKGYESWTDGSWCWLLSNKALTSTPTKNKNIHRLFVRHHHTQTRINTQKKAETATATATATAASSSNSAVRSNGDADKGYESWTEGSWCLLLPNNNDDNNNNIPTHTTAKNKTTHHRCTRTTTNTRNEKWNKMFRRLVAYKEQYQNTNVIGRYKEDPQLGRWVGKQRNTNKTGSILKYRVDILDSIGFVWEIHDIVPWIEMYQRLIAYKKQHKSTSVPTNYKDDRKLGRWVQYQRENHKNKELSVERTNYLESIGFVWKFREQVPWIEMYEKLITYKKCYQSTRVPFYYTEDPRLGSWVAHQRMTYNKGKLLEKRTELLNSIDFVWCAK